MQLQKIATQCQPQRATGGSKDTLKILLRDTHRQQYVTNQGWSDQSAEARVFGSRVEATQFCEEQGLRGMAVVYTFDRPSRDFELPIYSSPLQTRGREFSSF